MGEMSNTQGESYNSSMRLMFLSAKEQRRELGNAVTLLDMVVSLWGVGDAKPWSHSEGGGFLTCRESRISDLSLIYRKSLHRFISPLLSTPLFSSWDITIYSCL